MGGREGLGLDPKVCLQSAESQPLGEVRADASAGVDADASAGVERL